MSCQADSSWISTTSALPVFGQPVEFMLDARECAIVGVYSQEGFHSRWTYYAAALVSKWRGAPAVTQELMPDAISVERERNV